MTKKGEHLDKSPLTTNPPYESGHDVERPYRPTKTRIAEPARDSSSPKRWKRHHFGLLVSIPDRLHRAEWNRKGTELQLHAAAEALHAGGRAGHRERHRGRRAIGILGHDRGVVHPVGELGSLVVFAVPAPA